MIKPVAGLIRRIGYTFKDESLCELALSHRSCGKQNNERLEFLGDSILNFVIAEALFHHFPSAREGELSRLRAKLVKGATLSEVGRELELGDYLRLGSGELKSGGYRRDSILADAVEALIGAIYLDSDLETARTFILAQLGGRLEKLDLKVTLKDPKTRLQEFLQSRRLDLPEYDLEKVQGDPHDQTFYIACRVSGLNEPARGEGSSRRKAEQQAARMALIALEVEKA